MAVEPAPGFDEELLLTNPDFYLRPDRHALYKRLREQAPVSFHPERRTQWLPQGGRGYWAVLRYEDVRYVTRNPQLFSSAQGTNPSDEPEHIVRALGMLHMDAPGHRQYRAIVGSAFAVRHLESLMPLMRAYSDKVIDTLLAEPDVDIVDKLVNTYPISVIAGMMNLPAQDYPMFVENTRLAFSPDRVRGVPAHQALTAYGVKLADERRRNPGEDLISRIVTAEFEGRHLTDQEVGGFVSLLIGAGAETTGSTLAAGIQLLERHPEQWRLLEQDRSLVPNAVNEILRHSSAVINFRRNATCDLELGGKQIRAGEKVVMFYESANFDETVFPDPEPFDITRKEASKQVSFGAGGPHQCLGEQLGKREIGVFLDRLLDRVDHVDITTPLRLTHSPRFNMAAELRGTFHPR